MDKTIEINEVVTFIKATREEAVALAYDIGGGEVHALHIQRGFGMPSENPVGYLVMPLKREWAGLTEDEREHFRKLGFVGVLAVENTLKEKNS